MTTYATVEELTERLSADYSLPANAEQQLAKASELIDYFTLGRAALAWDDSDSDSDTNFAISQAVCDQVEFWCEVGEPHDTSGLRGSLVGGRLQVHPVSGTLAPRARRTLSNAGLYWEGVAVR